MLMVNIDCFSCRPITSLYCIELNIPTPQLTWVTSRKQLTYRQAEDYLRQVRQNGMQDITACKASNIADQLCKS